MMATVELFVSHTPNRDDFRVNRSFVNNVIAGADFHEGPIPEGFFLDNTGDNISSHNRSFCELTTLYWAWKNKEADYYGFCHYRRLFSFSTRPLQRKRQLGVYPFKHLSEKALQELCWDEDAVYAAIEGYDFIVAQHIDTKELYAKSILGHWADAPDLRNEDYERFLGILKETYPHLSEIALSFSQGRSFYPCNMFIARKEILDEYCSILFDVLQRFEECADMTHSRIEEMRVTGHLAERFCGIYYEYLRREGSYKLKELEIALFEDTTPAGEVKRTKEDARGIALAAGEGYVPYLEVTLESLCQNASGNMDYDIVIFNKDISSKSRSLLKQAVRKYPHFSLRFIGVAPLVEDYNLTVQGIIDHVTVETFYRFLILDVMKDYDKVLYLDCDLLVQDDISQLFDEDIGNCLVGAVIDADYLSQLNNHGSRYLNREMAESERLRYTRDVLGMSDPYKYFQAGVLMLNITELNKASSTEKLMQMALRSEFIYMDQDILNKVCDGRVHFFDLSWNVQIAHRLGPGRLNLIKEMAPAEVAYEYLASRQYPRIIHYSGAEKPWNQPDCDFATEYWMVARSTQLYETMLHNMIIFQRKNRLRFKWQGIKKDIRYFQKRVYRHLKRRIWRN